MSHDVFTRKDAMQQDLPFTQPLTDEQIERAQQTVAANSLSGEECTMFLEMLGIPLSERN